MAYTHYMAMSWEEIAPLKPYIERASDIAREIGDARLLARTLFIIGSVDQMEAKLDEAEAKCSEAVRIAQAGGFPGIVVQAQALLGLQRGWQGDFASAIAINRETELAALAVQRRWAHAQVAQGQAAALPRGRAGVGTEGQALAHLTRLM
jgi:hypothetical protein